MAIAADGRSDREVGDKYFTYAPLGIFINLKNGSWIITIHYKYTSKLDYDFFPEDKGEPYLFL